MMRHRGARRRRRLRGADVEPAIDDRRVHADDFERHALGERERELRLAARRRTRDANAVDARSCSLTRYWPRRNSRSRSSSVTCGPRRPAVIARFAALRAFHLAQQRIHLFDASGGGSRAPPRGTPSSPAARCASASMRLDALAVAEIAEHVAHQRLDVARRRAAAARRARRRAAGRAARRRDLQPASSSPNCSTRSASRAETSKLDRHEQRLRLQPLRRERRFEPLVGDALVRGVHVDDDQPGRVLREHVDARELREREPERRNRRVAHGDGGVGGLRVQAVVERQIVANAGRRRREPQRLLPHAGARRRQREQPTRCRERARRQHTSATPSSVFASAASTVRNTKSCTSCESRNRISSFAGCALTSTRRGSSATCNDVGGLPRLKQHVLIAEPHGMAQQLVAHEPVVDERELHVGLAARECRRREPTAQAQALRSRARSSARAA